MLFYYYNSNFEWDEETQDYIETLKFEECKKVKGIRIDRRWCADPVDLSMYNGNKEKANADWYGEGRNHRVVDGCIERDFDDEFYIIEINTLEELLDFQDKYNVNASVRRRKSGYVYNGKELYTFDADYYME
jgi:hypothetical protein